MPRQFPTLAALSVFPARPPTPSDASAVFELVDAVGSPCNVVLPEIFAECVLQFKATLEESVASGRLSFAAKANKSDALLAVAADLGIGVDVASREEMVAALSAGVPGERLMLNGPHKPISVLRLAIRHSAIIAIDSLEELSALQELACEERKPPRIVLRWRSPGEPDSRFGMVDEEVVTCIKTLASGKFPRCLEGFSVHLKGYDILDRARAGRALINWIDLARSLGSSPRLIDLGGGWPVSYVSEREWLNFARNIQRSHYHAARVPAGSYPYGAECAGADAVRRCLSAPIDGERSLSSLARDRDVTIAIEPGRALLDQAGASLFRILGVRDRDGDYGVVTVDGQSFSLSEQWFGSEFLPDPILVRSNSATSDGDQDHWFGCVAGSSCLEGDMLTWRKLRFDCRPSPGDVLVYVNTAGYQMDSNESSFHRRPLPEKVAVWRDASRWRWCRDVHFVDSCGKDGTRRGAQQ